MKIMKTILSVAAVVAATTSSVWAQGTAAGTDVDNTASISYKVGTVDQTDIYSSPGGNTVPGEPGVDPGAPTVADTRTRFVVDKKIDLTVTELADVNVVPSATGQNLTYTLTNTGNSTEFFKLDETQVGSDQFDASACTIAAAAPAVAGTGADTFQLNADESSTITVSCTIPAASGTVTNGAISNVDLKATAVTDTGGATVHTESATDTAAGVEVVLADANATTGDSDATDGDDRNASHSAVNSYVINSADLTVQKTQAVTSMPINGADDPADTNFHIPGSTIEYTIVVTNDVADGTPDAPTATGIVITDQLPTGTTGPTATSNGLAYASCSITAPGLAVADCNEAAGLVTSDAFDLAAGETATLTITATVN